MANIQAEQAFYSLTLQPNSLPIAACMCQVIPNLKNTDQQIFEARGSKVFLRKVGKRRSNEGGDVVAVETIVEMDTFSTVRGVGAFRVSGTDQGTFQPLSWCSAMHSDGAPAL